ncbi:TIGR03943 family putative permease subunit [Cyanobacterium sp. uoEpiScrs1]|uniref:TIGR03943 family putative permease subunit n=1 Tax=Cyanobacterium sp. uoEpiScrs1 TaxID=2976343 RepID=UPI00226AD98C|nr:TIGR03943 family protein [Cyanobacterium sp. uoEpiScrs1]
MTFISKLKSSRKFIIPGLDVLALLAWTILLFKYWATGQLKLLIHPNYFWLVFVTSVILFILTGFKISQFIKSLRRKNTTSTNFKAVQHVTLFPPVWSSSLLIVTAIAGLMIPPTIFNSKMALQRGISESLPVTRTQTQIFRSTLKPEERSLIEWIRTLNAYPEPDAYEGQKAKVTGFVVHSSILPRNYVFLSRFIITCCAVDAYPVGLPLKLKSDRNTYPPDTWLEVEALMITETLKVDTQTMKETPIKKRQLVLEATSIKTIPTPDSPYGY